MSKYPDILIGQLFPNPPLEDGKVYLACTGNISKPVAVIVRTTEGDVVFQTAHCLPRIGRTIELDFSKLLPGSYDLYIVSGTHREHRSLTISSPKKAWNWKRLFAWKPKRFNKKATVKPDKAVDI